MKSPERIDEMLMQELGQGNKSAFELIVKRHQTEVFRFCMHYLKDVERAKDLAQETFLRVYTACERFDPSRKFKPWILCIARNLCLNDLKRKKTVHMESLEEYASSAREESGLILRTSEESPDEQAMSGERLALLSKALDSLSEDAREIIMLRYFERMSSKDIGEIVGSSEGAVRTRIHRILKSLQTRFAERRDDW